MGSTGVTLAVLLGEASREALVQGTPTGGALRQPLGCSLAFTQSQPAPQLDDSMHGLGERLVCSMRCQDRSGPLPPPSLSLQGMELGRFVLEVGLAYREQNGLHVPMNHLPSVGFCPAPSERLPEQLGRLIRRVPRPIN